MLEIVSRNYILSVPLWGSGLSAAEMEVLRLLMQGHSVTEISQLKGRTVKTVSTQKRCLYEVVEPVHRFV
ncbi:TPA: hypothetical protein HLV26_25150 [Escherichia coli]|nr:hypothetical protein [Shigella sonnei]EGD7418697.1 hypothetical protein [Escherichia coli]EHS1737874.1 hypothetical protein [Escherichia coli]EKY9078974.1 hypothetical protein [Escherichia coli]WBW56236.1 hypothetical protein PHKIIMPN_00100 [Escherichia coli]